MISIILVSVFGTQNQHSFTPTLAKSSGGGASIYLRLLRKAKTEVVPPLRTFLNATNAAEVCDPHSEEVDFTGSGWYIGGLSITRSGSIMEKLKLLVVEDEDSLRTLLRSELEAHGFAVDDADGGTIAMKALSNTRYDVVILDVRMPDMDGLEVLRNIRKDNLADK